MRTRCENCGTVMPTEGTKCLNCGAVVGDPNPPYSMKWFKFLTKYLLIWGAFLMFLIGVVILLGLPYALQGSDSTLVYTRIPLLIIADTILGALCCVLGVMYLITRNKLIRFRRSGPILLYISYGLSILLPVIYSALTRFYLYPVGSSLLGLTEIAELAAMVLGIVLNVIYFRNRSHMFD